MAYTPLDHPFINRLRERVLFAAGPIGSSILAMKPGPDYGGKDGCNEYLVISDPDALANIQRSLYAAGADADTVAATERARVRGCRHRQHAGRWPWPRRGAAGPRRVGNCCKL